MIYPNGKEVTYSYNVGVLLNSMDGKERGARYIYVEQLDYDEFEQRGSDRHIEHMAFGEHFVEEGDKHYLFPLPLNEIAQNDALRQNDGW